MALLASGETPCLSTFAVVANQQLCGQEACPVYIMLHVLSV